MAGLTALGLVAVPAQAQHCWNQTLVEAAQVKEFDIMLMVATLRCQTKGVDLSQSYNRFVVKHRPALLAVGKEIMGGINQNIGGAKGSKAVLKAYDKMGVTMANKYGRGVEGMDCADYGLMIAQAETTPAGRKPLVTLAQRAGVDPSLPVAACAVTVTASAP